MGVSGTLHCNPMNMTFTPESKMAFDADPTKYGIVFTFANDATRSETSAEGENMDGTYFWMDSR